MNLQIMRTEFRNFETRSLSQKSVERQVCLHSDDGEATTTLKGYIEINEFACDLIELAQELLYAAHQYNAANACDDVFGELDFDIRGIR
jgi:hypothetical protein